MSRFFPRVALTVIWGALLACQVEAQTRRGSAERIEADIQEIQWQLDINQQRREAFQQQALVAASEDESARQAREMARQAVRTAREELQAAHAKAIWAREQRHKVEQDLIQELRQEPDWKQAQARQQLAQQQWESHRARVLLQLARQTPYKDLQALLRDARLRADPLSGPQDPAQRRVAAETVNALESRIARLEEEALAADPLVLAARQERDQAQAQLEEIDQAIRRSVQEKPEYQEATQAMEATRAAQTQAQQEYDEAKSRETSMESMVSQARTRLQTAQAGLRETEKEELRLNTLLRAKNEELRRARPSR